MGRWALLLVMLVTAVVGAKGAEPDSVAVAGTEVQFAVADDKPRLRKVDLSCGLMAEFNTMSLIHWRTEHVTTRMRPGASLGGFVNLRMSRYFSVQIEFLLHYKNSLLQQDDTRSMQEYFGSELPVYVIYHVNRKRLQGLYFGVGLFSEFGFKSTFKYNGKSFDAYDDTDLGVPVMRDSNVGYAFLAGYEFPCGLQLNVAYKISVSNLLDTDYHSTALRPQTFSVGVAYRWK